MTGISLNLSENGKNLYRVTFFIPNQLLPYNLDVLRQISKPYDQ